MCIGLIRRHKWLIQLKNTSLWPVEFLEVTIDSCLEANIQKEIMQLNEKVIQDHVPILPGMTVNFLVNIFGAVNLMNQILPATSQGNSLTHYQYYTCVKFTYRWTRQLPRTAKFEEKNWQVVAVGVEMS